MPSVSNKARHVTTTVLSLGENRLSSHEGYYTLVPVKKSITEYKEGLSSRNCAGRPMLNPYVTCIEKRLPDIC